MWVRTVLILLLSAVSGLPRDSNYLYEDANGDEDVSFYGNYDISVITMPVLTTTGVETHTRIRTYGVGEKNTHSPEEIKNIKVVLQDSVSNGKVKPRAAEDPGKVYISNSYQYFEESPEQHGFTQKTESNKGELRDLVRSWMTTDSSKPHHSDAYQYLEDLQVRAQNSEKITSIQGVATVFTLSPSIVTWVPEPTYNHSKKASKPNHLTLPPREIEDIKDVPKEMIFNQGATTWHHEEQDKDYATKSIKYTFVSQKAIDDSDGNEALQNIFPNRKVVSWAVQSITPGTPYSEASWVLTPIMNLTEVLDEDISTLPANKIMEYIAQNTENWEPFEADVNSSNIVGVLRQEGQTNSTIDDYTNSTITVEPTTPPKPTIRLDVQGLLDLIANLTYDYDMNLTQRFNETLAKFSVPSCGSPTTTVTPTTVPPEHDFANTSIVAKCFVCGLDKQEIPQDSYCADAFAGEFIPLVPVNPRARGQIATYRKYCRYLDVRGYMENPEEPRAMYGRFTGGCSVRWIDLSGVYTQRTCRNRRRAVMGKHFTSKRMAKLEMALNDVDEGCIISPMATLVPLSRGISLYARFHACVCTGAWCNRSEHNEPWMAITVMLFWYFKLIVLYSVIKVYYVYIVVYIKAILMVMHLVYNEFVLVARGVSSSYPVKL